MSFFATHVAKQSDLQTQLAGRDWQLDSASVESSSRARGRVVDFDIKTHNVSSKEVLSNAARTTLYAVAALPVFAVSVAGAAISTSLVLVGGICESVCTGKTSATCCETDPCIAPLLLNPCFYQIMNPTSDCKTTVRTYNLDESEFENFKVFAQTNNRYIASQPVNSESLKEQLLPVDSNQEDD